MPMDKEMCQVQYWMTDYLIRVLRIEIEDCLFGVRQSAAAGYLQSVIPASSSAYSNSVARRRKAWCYSPAWIPIGLSLNLRESVQFPDCRKYVRVRGCFGRISICFEDMHHWIPLLSPQYTRISSRIAPFWIHLHQLKTNDGDYLHHLHLERWLSFHRAFFFWFCALPNAVPRNVSWNTVLPLPYCLSHDEATPCICPISQSQGHRTNWQSYAITICILWLPPNPQCPAGWRLASYSYAPRWVATHTQSINANIANSPIDISNIHFPKKEFLREHPSISWTANIREPVPNRNKANDHISWNLWLLQILQVASTSRSRLQIYIHGSSDWPYIVKTDTKHVLQSIVVNVRRSWDHHDSY